MNQTALYRGGVREQPRSRKNVGRTDRMVSAALGVMALRRIGRRPGVVPKLLTATSAFILFKKAATGRSRFYEAAGLSSAPLAEGAGINVDAAITIDRPREEVYTFWRDLSNLPFVMSHIEAVTHNADGTTHWWARTPIGRTAEWDARIIDDTKNERIAWESIEGAEIESAGSVQFRDVGDRGTEVRVMMRYVPPAGVLGFAVGKAVNARTQLEVVENLRELKRMMETGVIITTEGQPTGAVAELAGGASR